MERVEHSSHKILTTKWLSRHECECHQDCRRAVLHVVSVNDVPGCGTVVVGRLSMRPPAASLWFSCATWIGRWCSSVSRTAAVSDPHQASRSADDSLQRGSSSDDFLLSYRPTVVSSRSRPYSRVRRRIEHRRQIKKLFSSSRILVFFCGNMFGRACRSELLRATKAGREVSTCGASGLLDAMQTLRRVDMHITRSDSTAQPKQVAAHADFSCAR